MRRNTSRSTVLVLILSGALLLSLWACSSSGSGNNPTFPSVAYSNPETGNLVFIYNADESLSNLLVLDLVVSGETFADVKPAYRCNGCTKEFPQDESKYRHVYSFTVNMPMLLEMKQMLNNTEELKIWEEKNKQYNKNIEETKKMQNEIRNQLKTLIEQQVKSR